MPAFYILVLLAAALLFLLLAGIYRPLGKLFGRLIEDAKSAMFDEEKENDNE